MKIINIYNVSNLFLCLVSPLEMMIMVAVLNFLPSSLLFFSVFAVILSLTFGDSLFCFHPPHIHSLFIHSSWSIFPSLPLCHSQLQKSSLEIGHPKSPIFTLRNPTLCIIGLSPMHLFVRTKTSNKNYHKLTQKLIF